MPETADHRYRNIVKKLLSELYEGLDPEKVFMDPEANAQHIELMRNKVEILQAIARDFIYGDDDVS